MARTPTTVAVLAEVLVAVSAATGCTATATATGPPRPAASAPTTSPPVSRPVRTSSPGLVAAPAPATGSAAAALAHLAVKGRAAKTGYSRARFGQAWADVDRNGCDTRNDVLRRDLTAVRLTPGTNGCQVAAGTLADPYSGTTIAFTSGASTSTSVQIDHVVALSNAWQTGAGTWTPDRRQDLANDPLNLLAVQGRLNEQKGDGDAATWLPPNKAIRCAYVARQVAVKARYGLWVTPPEKAAITRVLAACPGQPLPAGDRSRAPLATSTPEDDPPASTAPPAATPTSPTAVPTAPAAEGGVYYASCAAARAAGKAPLDRGQPGYRAGLDRDHDGVACE